MLPYVTIAGKVSDADRLQVFRMRGGKKTADFADNADKCLAFMLNAVNHCLRRPAG